MGDLDAETKEAIHKISKEVEIQNDKLEVQYQQSRIRRQARTSERAHFLVSLAVLSGVLTYYFRNDGLYIMSCLTGMSDAFCAILTASTLSVILFIPMKLMLTTLRPVTNSEFLNKLNDVFLPAINVSFIINIVPLLFIYLVFPGFEYPGFTIKYIGVATLLSMIPAWKYAQKYQTAMKRVRTTSTRRNVIVTGGAGGPDAEIRLTNPNSTEIPGEEVSIIVDAPQEIGMEIGQTTGDVNEGDVLKLATELPANKVMDLPVTLNPVPDDPQGEIDIRVEVANQPPQTTSIPIGVEQDHSGTTNIG